MNKKLVKRIVRRKKPEFSGKFILLVFSAIWKITKSFFKIPQEIMNLLYVRKLKKNRGNINKKESGQEIKIKTKGKKRKFFSKIFLILVVLLLISGGSLAIWVSRLTIPSIEEIQELNIAQATKIFDKNGELLYNIYGEEKRTIVSIDNISKHMINASIAVEDKDFYNHSGVKISSILKAAWENQFGNRKYQRGGSTITQQVIKNTILTREKTYTRKIKEAILAYKLEKIWTKKQILELYLNESAYGGTLYGVEEAAQYYFGIPASDLDIAQSAYLAAMPQAPTTYSPYGKHRDALDKRKNLILSLMLNQGYINRDDYQKARDEKVEFVFKSDQTGIKAPHFVMYVIDELKKNYTQDQLRNSGLRVYTTLDLKLQEDLQAIAKKQAVENEEKYNASNVGIVVIDAKTGYILAMIGSRDYFDKKIDGKYNIATAKRQPGSSFKPIVYLTALQKGYTPETVVWDVPTEFSARCLPGKVKKYPGAVCYSPQNFDYKFKGPIKLKYALPESRNIPAVKFLHLVGVQSALDNAKLLGIKSLNKGAGHYGLNLVLGGGEVQLLNLVSAYSVFSQGGLRSEPTAITKITDTTGKVISEPILGNIRVMDEKEILWLNKILSTKEFKIKTFGWNSPLYYEGRQVAVKTGTTDNYRDAWTVGYDPSVAVGAWVGNNNNTPMKPSKAAHLLWRAAMDRVLEDYPNINFKEPKEIDYSGMKPVLRGVWQGNKIIKIDTKNNTLATDETPEEFIKEIIIPEYHTILHWVNKKDPLGPIPQSDEERDDIYPNWEAGVQQWVGKNEDLVSEEIKKLLQILLQLKKVNNNQDSENTEDLEANL